MTELSDYRRYVEKPEREAWAKERADLIARRQAAESSAAKWKAEAERMAEALNAFYDAIWELVAALAEPAQKAARVKAATDAARRLCLAEHGRRLQPQEGK